MIFILNISFLFFFFNFYVSINIKEICYFFCINTSIMPGLLQLNRNIDVIRWKIIIYFNQFQLRRFLGQYTYIYIHIRSPRINLIHLFALVFEMVYILHHRNYQLVDYIAYLKKQMLEAFSF